MPVPNFSPGEVLTASAMDSIGLWLIRTTTWSSQTSINVDTVFSDNYKNYYIVCNAAGGGPQNVSLTFRSGGADTGAGLYKFQSQFINYTATGWNTGAVASAANNYQEFLRIQGSEEASANLYVMGPKTPTVTTFQGNCSDNFLYRTGGGILNSTVSVDGFRLSSGVATTGAVRVYGYRN